MISINQKRFVNALKQKKYRTAHGLFIVEGVKMLQELLKSDYEVKAIYGTKIWIENNIDVKCTEVSEKELKNISSLKTPNHVLAVVEQKTCKLDNPDSELTIALETIQDPGNLGTIVRTADWFGIKNIICSNDSVDNYNPKVIQATMGSFFRVNLIYTDLKAFFLLNRQLTVYGAVLEGDNIYNSSLKSKGAVILMGNESKGISNELMPSITNKLCIPKVGGAESLNVAIATAVFCSECKKF